ncbi:MAG: HIT family protein [Methanoregula sp.]
MDAVPCPFCSPKNDDIVFCNRLWYARWDAFPASRGHLLVIPFHHVASYFETLPEEKALLPEMLEACRKILDDRFLPSGYNIVINCGSAADQQVMHCHVHLIPRYAGDADNPPGGIRGFVMDACERVM